MSNATGILKTKTAQSPVPSAGVRATQSDLKSRRDDRICTPNQCRPSLRDLLAFFGRYPKLKHWAILEHPSGMTTKILVTLDIPVRSNIQIRCGTGGFEVASVLAWCAADRNVRAPRRLRLCRAAFISVN